ncbi:MAG: NAD(P) transhydrogenase subunit alpha part 2 [Micavibrio sp.]|nr:MAG: NAD(P) transhydrogenase subunit alpha part 2 [Micavibrio sp.]
MADNEQNVTESAADLANKLKELSDDVASLAVEASESMANSAHGEPFLITGLTVFVLACFVGYHVVWRVTPALHSPLMGITNAISSVIIVGAILAVAPTNGEFSLLAFLAIILASVNIFGGFIITRRMLHMFKKKG